jgi:hypothetical protein
LRVLPSARAPLNPCCKAVVAWGCAASQIRAVGKDGGRALCLSAFSKGQMDDVVAAVDGVLQRLSQGVGAPPAATSTVASGVRLATNPFESEERLQVAGMPHIEYARADVRRLATATTSAEEAAAHRSYRHESSEHHSHHHHQHQQQQQQQQQQQPREERAARPIATAPSSGFGAVGDAAGGVGDVVPDKSRTARRRRSSPFDAAAAAAVASSGDSTAMSARPPDASERRYSGGAGVGMSQQSYQRAADTATDAEPHQARAFHDGFGGDDGGDGPQSSREQQPLEDTSRDVDSAYAPDGSAFVIDGPVPLFNLDVRLKVRVCDASVRRRLRGSMSHRCVSFLCDGWRRTESR